MEEWKDQRFQGLLTSNIWRSNPDNIEKILKMEEWKDQRFQGLLTSNIWNSNPDDIKKVLKMEKWKDQRFQGLLTSNIWSSNPDDIEKILKMSKLQEEDYEHLLTPSIFNLTVKYILSSIELLEEYGIGKYVTIACLRKSTKNLRNLMEYMTEKNIPLIIKKKDESDVLNPILNANKTHLKKKYGIDIDNLKEKGVSK